MRWLRCVLLLVLASALAAPPTPTSSRRIRERDLQSIRDRELANRQGARQLKASADNDNNIIDDDTDLADDDEGAAVEGAQMNADDQPAAGEVDGDLHDSDGTKGNRTQEGNRDHDDDALYDDSDDSDDNEGI